MEWMEIQALREGKRKAINEMIEELNNEKNKLLRMIKNEVEMMILDLNFIEEESIKGRFTDEEAKVKMLREEIIRLFKKEEK